MSSFDVEVRTQLPREHWRHLAVLADQHNTTIGALVAELVRRQLGPVPPIVPSSRQRAENYDPLKAGQRVDDGQRNSIRKLHGEGLPDVDIAKRLGISNSTVGYHRKQLGLPSHFRGRGRIS